MQDWRELIIEGRNALAHACVWFVVAVSLWPKTCLGGGGPKNVLLVINENSPISQSIGAYYQQKRDIPERNVCRITCSTDEYVSGSECETNVVAPIRSFIESSGLHDRLDYILLTKGIPLKAGYDNAGFYGPLSVTSVLACVGESSITGPIVNPYGPTASPAAPEQYFSHQLEFGGKHFYAVTRLDAYTEAEVQRMIDDSLIAQAAPGLFLLDGRYVTGPLYVLANDRLRDANNALLAAGYDTYYDNATFDENISEFVGGQTGVMGYFSWGSTEYTFTQEAYVSNQFIPGSIADTFVSYSGRTFTYPPSPGQSLIADLIPQGVSGANGYVSEPFVSVTTYPNVLFDRYLQGYNLAESFMAANPELFWKSVVVGDPLMAPYATPPSVTITSPDPELVLHGTVQVSVAAADDSGIQKVEFYVDDELVATAAASPYQFTWDTVTCSDGMHVLEAIAYEDSPVFTQGGARLDVQVINTVLDVSSIGLLESVEEGRLVRLAEKIVVAGIDAFTDCIYVAEADRAAGVKVVGPVEAMTGALVTVVGEKRTMDGETVIFGTSLVVHGGSPLPAAVGMPNVWVGNRGTHAGAGASTLRAGLSNTGLLVKTWGYVVGASEHEFHISDGSIPAADGLGTSVKVSLENLAKPIPTRATGDYVAVTGISTYFWDGDALKPVLRPRFNSDIVCGLALSFSTITAPSGTIRSGWNLLSIPGIPVNPEADSVLAGIELDGCLYSWNPVTGSLITYDAFQPDLFPSLHIGVGFWLLASSASDLVVQVVGNDQPDVDMWVSLPAQGFSLIGHTFDHATGADNCFVSDGTCVVPIEVAADNGWVDGILYYWDNSSSALCTLDVGFGGANDLEPWHGYWIRAFRPNLAFIIPH